MIISPGFLLADLESEFRVLLDDAFRGGVNETKSWIDPESALKDPVQRAAFYSAAHAGFARAQAMVSERLLLLESNERRPADERYAIALRKIMDGIAWQIIANQMHVARRLFKGHKPPRLSESNFDSVRSAAKQITSDDFLTFALISDLTTFIQIGDLLTINAITGQKEVVEVKAGEKNLRIMQFIDELPNQPCQYKAFLELEHELGKHGIDQLQRVLRQAQRMHDMAELLKTGRGKDHDLDVEVIIPDEPIELVSYVDRLSSTIENSKEKGWAINVIDDCIYLGAYRGDMQSAASPMFSVWLEDLPDAKPRYPKHDLLQSLYVPLAVPFFAQLPIDQACDLLFGRCTVMVGLHLDSLIDVAKAQGISARWATKKETSKAPNARRAYKVGGQGIIFELGERQAFISDGLIVRMLFNGTTPASAVQLIQRTLTMAVD